MSIFYYIAEFKDGSSIMVKTHNVLPEKMIKTKIYYLGLDYDCILIPTNMAKDVIAYRHYTYDIDDIYDENQGECFQY